MPNPYAGNNKAAAFIDYYASPHMVESSVDRLYRGGVARQQAARQSAEREAYPERFRPPVRRTQAELDAYLQARVETELLHRQQRRAALQQALHPEIETPPQYMSKREVDRQVRRLYSEGVRQRQQREEAVAQIFGQNKSEKDLVQPARSPRERGELRQRETQWRPPSASVPHTDDNKVSLSSQYDYYANPQKFSEVYVVAKQRRPMTAQERAKQLKRLTDLSRPLSVTPRRVDEVPGSDEPPLFRVHRKVDYDDAI